MLLAEVLVKGMMEVVGMSPLTFGFFCAAPRGTIVPYPDRCFLRLSDTNTMWNGIIGMDGSKMGGHTIQPNRRCDSGAIRRWCKGWPWVPLTLARRAYRWLHWARADWHHHLVKCRPRLQRQVDYALIPCTTKTTNIGARRGHLSFNVVAM